MSHRRSILLIALCIVLVAAAGCTITRGKWHTVEEGQTLWRICWTYGVDLDEVARLNKIRDPKMIDVGQKIFIPGASYVRKVLPYAPPKPKARSNVKKKKGGAKVTKAPPAKKGLFAWPVKGTLTSRFGKRSGDYHDGIDVGAKMGTPVLASAQGEVVYADNAMRGYGNVIIIKHKGGYFTVYAHNDKNIVKKGKKVKKGERIALVGNTGKSTGPHLHFEIRYGGAPKNPLLYLP